MNTLYLYMYFLPYITLPFLGIKKEAWRKVCWLLICIIFPVVCCQDENNNKILFVKQRANQGAYRHLLLAAVQKSRSAFYPITQLYSYFFLTLSSYLDLFRSRALRVWLLNVCPNFSGWNTERGLLEPSVSWIKSA